MVSGEDFTGLGGTSGGREETERQTSGCRRKLSQWETGGRGDHTRSVLKGRRSTAGIQTQTAETPKGKIRSENLKRSQLS